MHQLHEREHVLGAVARALDEVHDGHGQALFVVGESGLGKTSVLGFAREHAQPDIDVGFASGERMERSVPFGMAVQLLSSLSAPVDLTRSPAVEVGAPSHRVLQWLTERVDRPLLLALDDVHWADADSLELFAFLARRLFDLPIVLIGTMRPWPSEAFVMSRGVARTGNAAVEHLSALSRGTVSTLLVERAGRAISDVTEQRSWSLTQGNPLLVDQVALALERGEEIPAAGEDATELSRNLLLVRFAGLDEASMLCARAACVIGSNFRAELAAEVVGLDDSVADAALDALCRSGHITDAGNGEMRFAHPLFAQALYDDLASPVRRRLHARIFHALADRGLDAEASEHAIHADLVGDERAVAVLERTGRAALDAGAVVSSTHHLEGAVRLSGDRVDVGLQLVYAEALSSSARREEAAEVCRRLLATHDLPWASRVETLRMLGQALYLTGAPDHGQAALEEAVEIAVAHVPNAAVQPLLDQALSAWMGTGPAAALPLAARARELAVDSDEALRDRADAAWGYLALEVGDPAGLAAAAVGARHLDRHADTHPLNPAELVWPWSTIYNYAMTANYAEQFDAAEAAFDLARDALGRAGAPNAMAMLAIYKGNLVLRRGRIKEALAEALSVTEPARLSGIVVPYAALMQAEALVWRGRLDEAEALCKMAEGATFGQWFADVWLSHIRGLRLLWQGDPAASDELLAAEEVTRRVGIAEPCHVQWAGHAVEAHVAAGRVADAGRVIDWLQNCAKDLPCRWPRFAAKLGRARLDEHAGDDAAAEAGYKAALAQIDGVDLPLQRLEALVAFGGFLRRRGRSIDARPVLADALRLADSHGAGWLAVRAHGELALAGGRRRRAQQAPDELTAAELRVARHAATGRTNAEIAGLLHLSVNTVETHLKHTYAKLRINSRRQLMTRVSDLEGNIASNGDNPG